MFIEADTHTHSLASTHAYSTILEMAKAASNVGLQAIAITDHASGGEDAPHIWHFHNMPKSIPRKLFDVNMIFGAEVNILDFDGNVDFGENELKRLDWIIASMHFNTMKHGSVNDYSNAYKNLCKNFYIDVIGHSAMEDFKFDIDDVLPFFKEYEKLVEINESSIACKPNVRKNYVEIIKGCKKFEVPIIVNTDAHFCLAVGKVPLSEQLLTELSFPKKLIFNSEWNKVKERIEKKHSTTFDF